MWWVAILALRCAEGLLVSTPTAVTVNIYPEFVAQNGRSHYDSDRWNSHNGLSTPHGIPLNNGIATRAGRWIAADASTFGHAHEDPHRKGYPDPKYFNTSTVEETVGRKFLDNLEGYRLNRDILVELRGEAWPSWMNKSLHDGKFPNNLDAAGDMVLFLLRSISRYTQRKMPKYFEVINEPGGKWNYLSWDDVIRYHHIVAAKVKRYFPEIKVGGPTNTGHIQGADEHDFKVWKKLRAFLDMSLEHMDFFSFHAYSSLKLNGQHHDWGYMSEARLVAVVDLIESYAHYKRNQSVPIIISEYGLGNTGDSLQSANVGEWAYAFAHNAKRFDYLGLRGVIDIAIAFLLDHSRHAHASLLRPNNTYTHVAKAYQFWQPFSSDHQFLRTDSEFDGKQRLLTPITLANPKTKELFVLLQNYHQTETKVKLNFVKQWQHPHTIETKCLYLNSHHVPTLSDHKGLTFVDNTVSVPSESTCYIVARSTYDFTHTPTVHEQMFYAEDIVVPIHRKSVSTAINLSPHHGHIQYAVLRIAVNTVSKHADIKPKSVTFNGHLLSSCYALYQPDRGLQDTIWDVYVYHVPVSAVKQSANTVHLSFAQDGGYVSSVALIIGSLSAHSTPVVG